jgi:hypothetical protein
MIEHPGNSISHPATSLTMTLDGKSYAELTLASYKEFGFFFNTGAVLVLVVHVLASRRSIDYIVGGCMFLLHVCACVCL